MPLALLMLPRWGLPRAVPLALLMLPRWGCINVAPLGLTRGVAPGFINVAPLGLWVRNDKSTNYARAEPRFNLKPSPNGAILI